MQPSGSVHFPVSMLTMRGEIDLQLQACCQILVHVVSQQITDTLPRPSCSLNADSYHRYQISYPSCVRHLNRGFDQNGSSSGHFEHKREHTMIATGTTMLGRTSALYKVSCGLLILLSFLSSSSVAFPPPSFIHSACR
jgi:hypothetical protein